MTTRAEAQAEELARHRTRALLMLISCAVVALVFTAAIALMATHQPRTLAEAEDVTGPWSANVTLEWDHLVVTHSVDLSLGNLDWEVTRGEENETIDDGSQTEEDDELLTITVGPGDYGVYVSPTGVNSGVEYDVTVREAYISPATITLLRWAGAFVLFFLAPFLWYVFMTDTARKHQEEYRLARIGIALTMALSGIFAFTPWV